MEIGGEPRERERKKERPGELMSHTELNLERHESAFCGNAFSSREMHRRINKKTRGGEGGRDA